MARMKTTLVALALFASAAATLTLGAQSVTKPFEPQPILQGGQVIPLFPPASRYLKAEKVGEVRTFH